MSNTPTPEPGAPTPMLCDCSHPDTLHSEDTGACFSAGCGCPMLTTRAALPPEIETALDDFEKDVRWWEDMPTTANRRVVDATRARLDTVILRSLVTAKESAERCAYCDFPKEMACTNTACAEYGVSPRRAVEGRAHE